MLKSAKRISVSILVLASVFSAPANAQIVASGSLNDVDPWGVGWKNNNTGGLSPSLWSATSADTVNELLGSIEAQALTSAQADLLRAIILSGGKAPSGDITYATSERLRLLRELGENARATNLLQRFPNEEWSEDPHKYEADLDLATGDNKRACAAVELASGEDPFWQTLRATCFALAGNAPAANLAAEMAVSSGEEDPWFFEAVNALAEIQSGNEKVKLPPANYSSGAAMALSLAGDFPANPDAATVIPVHYAALLSERPDASDELRVQAMLHAARAGVIDAPTARRAMVTPKPAPVEPDPALPADQQPPASSDILRNPLERAVDSVTDPDVSMHDKAVKLLAALVSSHGNLEEYSLQASILLPELKSIPQLRETAQLSPAFVEAALAAGDVALAQRWRNAMDNPFDEPPPRPKQEIAGLVQQPQPIQLDPATGKPISSGPVQLAPTPGNAAPTLDAQLQALNASNETQITAQSGQPQTLEALPPQPRLPAILHSEWDKARFDFLIFLASENTRKQQSITVANTLIGQADRFPIEVNQYLSILSGLGYAIPPEARRVMAEYQQTIPAMDVILADYQRNAAQNVGAIGEASLRSLLILRDNQPHSGSLIAYANSLNALVKNGLRKNARAIAYEAIAPWGKPKG